MESKLRGEKLINIVEENLAGKFRELENIALFNQEKVLNAFQKNKIALNHFSGTTGYGYDDQGREKLAKLFADVFKTDDAIVSPHISSGTHALTIALFGLLTVGDNFLVISGKPYDTLDEVIRGKGTGSLEDYKIDCNIVELKDGILDSNEILRQLKKKKPRVVFLQRSRGYSERNSISISDMELIFAAIKNVAPKTVIMVDNCYGEFTEMREPSEAGADVVVGSLIKNPGGGIAPTGAYIAGRADCIKKIAARFSSPSLLCEVGSYEPGYRLFFQGLFMAPHTTLQAMKGALLVSNCMQALHYEAKPSKNSIMSDIVCSIRFNTPDELIQFCQNIQQNSPIDSHVTAMPWDMPGYKNQVIMAAGCFVQGASIELSCDAPIKPPYTAYLQGGLTYEHVKIAIRNWITTHTNETK